MTAAIEERVVNAQSPSSRFAKQARCATRDELRRTGS